MGSSQKQLKLCYEKPTGQCPSLFLGTGPTDPAWDYDEIEVIKETLRLPQALSSFPSSLSASSTLRALPRRRDSLATPESQTPSSASPSPRHHHVVAIQARRVAVVSFFFVSSPSKLAEVTVVSLKEV
nr:hypothetical protein Iba_chr11aCG19740 [Ipomoea batatas]GMD53129.1 hypothetical protein Iba_chr11bCG18180 [Ipomoea batatas]